MARLDELTAELGSGDQLHLSRLLRTWAPLADVSFADLFPPEFVTAHSRFRDMQEMVDEAGVEEAEFDGEGWDAFVRESTDFDGWESMKARAGEQ